MLGALASLTAGGGLSVSPSATSGANNSGTVRSGGDLFLGGNPNLALLGKSSSALPWLIGGALVAGLLAVFLWKR